MAEISPGGWGWSLIKLSPKHWSNHVVKFPSIIPGRNGEPMSNVDAAWLRMEDRTNLMTITGGMSFPEPLDFGQLKELVEDRLLYYDRFRQRVVGINSPIGHPRWVEDEHFALRSHLQRVALPHPGGKAELQEMISDLMSTPLDYTKPLWQMQYIENYRGGSAVAKRLERRTRVDQGCTGRPA